MSWLDNILQGLQTAHGSMPASTPAINTGAQPTGPKPTNGLDIGAAIQAMLANQATSSRDAMFHFGHSAKPMLRQTLGGQYEGDPSAKPEGLDAFYKMNPQVAAAHGRGEMYTGPNGMSGGNFPPASGSTMVNGVETPMTQVQATQATKPPAFPTFQPPGSPAGTEAFNTQFGQGNNAPMPGGGQMPIGSNYHAALQPVLEAMRQAQKKTGGSFDWTKYLPTNTPSPIVRNG